MVASGTTMATGVPGSVVAVEVRRQRDLVGVVRRAAGLDVDAGHRARPDAVADLAVGVVAPARHRGVEQHGAAVVAAGADVLDPVAGQLAVVGVGRLEHDLRGVGVAAADAELVLVVGAPAEHRLVLGLQRLTGLDDARVVVSGDDVRDPGEVVRRGRRPACPRAGPAPDGPAGSDLWRPSSAPCRPRRSRRCGCSGGDRGRSERGVVVGVVVVLHLDRADPGIGGVVAELAGVVGAPAPDLAAREAHRRGHRRRRRR